MFPQLEQLCSGNSGSQRSLTRQIRIYSVLGVTHTLEVDFRC